MSHYYNFKTIADAKDWARNHPTARTVELYVDVDNDGYVSRTSDVWDEIDAEIDGSKSEIEILREGLRMLADANNRLFVRVEALERTVNQSAEGG